MRKVLGVYGNPNGHWIGDGFPVRSLFSHASHGQHISPFLLLDYAGPAEFAPADEPRGVGVHPHRGFETVTIVYKGEVEHRDSTGRGGIIGPGDVQWMTAASGILHEEFHSKAFTRQGGTLEMIQLWVNLPAKYKDATPGYQSLLNAEIPAVDLPNRAGRLRVIAGDYEGRKGAARTFIPINLWDMTLNRDGVASINLPEGHNAAVVVLKGTVQINDAVPVKEAEFALVDKTGDGIKLSSDDSAALLILSGEPIDEPVAMHGPFVMNTMDEIRQAMLDVQSGRFGEITSV